LLEREGLGEPAGFVELDVDGVVAPGQLAEALAGMQRFIGAYRHRMWTLGERGVGARAQRLLDQLEAGLGGNVHQLSQKLRRPSLVGVSNQARFRTGGTHLAHAPIVARIPELEFEQRQTAGRSCGGLGRHRLGRV